MADTKDGLGCPLKIWIAAGLVGVVVLVMLLVGDYSWMAAIFVAALAAVLVGMILAWLICRPAERMRAAPATEPVDPLKIVETPAPAAPVTAAPAASPPPKAEAPAGAVPGRPAGLSGPRGGVPDDLKRIKGVGPKLESVLHGLGFYHFDQIAGWSAEEIAWVDENLAGFKGRVSRDDWVAQAKTLAVGGETAFSQKVDKGGVY